MAVRVPQMLQGRDPAELATAAGLSYVVDGEPGYLRSPRGGGFTYLAPDGDPIPASEHARLESLAVPPAWSDVWLAIHPESHLLATGRDDADRKQYRYHDRFRDYCDHLKFARLAFFPRGLAALRKQVLADLARSDRGAEFATAAAVRLIDVAAVRVGNARSADDGHFGATTLSPDHLTLEADGTAVLEFTGKGGGEREIPIESGRLCRALSALVEADDEHLFSWSESPGEPRQRISATQVNDYIARHAGRPFSAKDFRTWVGTVAGASAVLQGGDALAAADAAAEALGNTRAVARSSYVHPAIFDDPIELERCWARSRSGRWLDRNESAVAKLLAQRKAEDLLANNF